MKPKLDKLASFRINSERWEKFKEVAENQDKTATDLLNEYIDRVIGVGVGVADAPSTPKVSMQDIDKRIDARISAAIQEIDKRIDDKLNTASIQDIDKAVRQLIADSLEEGDVGESINKLQRKFSDENNELQCQIYALQNVLDELKQEILSKIDNISQNSSDVPSPQSPVTSHQSSVTSHQSSVTSPQSPVTSHQSSVTNHQLELIDLLGLGDILEGNPYDRHYLNSHILKVKEHKSQIESALQIKLNLSDPKYICREINKIIRGMGHKIENKQINKIETYWVVQP
ncbi:MAG: hypothetical protein ACKPBC_15470 [Sphaerospermopsis kisseleviana]